MAVDEFNLVNEASEMGGKPKGPSNRILLFLVILFALATVTMAVLLVVVVLTNVDSQNTKSKEQAQSGGSIGTTPEPAEDVCLTEGCVLAAARIRNSMDISVNPCDDFYQFACGSWHKQNVIPEDRSAYGIYRQLDERVAVKVKALLEEENKASEPEAVHKAKDFYKACVNEDQIEELGIDGILAFLENLGGWPVLGSHRGGNWNSDTFNLEDLLISVRNETNYLRLADIYSYQDDKNPKKHILKIDQPMLGMPSRDYYLKERNDSTIMAYQKRMVDTAVAFGADLDTAEQDAKEVVDFEIELANITMRREDRLDPEKLYNKMTVGELSNNFTGLDWKRLIKGIFAYINLEIDETEPVIVAAPSYFEKLMGVINKYPARVIANYLVGSRIYRKLFYLPAKIYDIELAYKKVLSGQEARSPRWKACTKEVVYFMQQAVGRLFIENYFKQEAKSDVLRMVEHLTEAFKDMVTELTWMENTTKAIAKEKADYMEPRIGYPDWIRNNTRLNEEDELIQVDINNPLKTLISIRNAKVLKNLKQLRMDYDKSQWWMSAATVNAYYDTQTNQITFPAAILQAPFYSHDQPAYLNYGGIGFVIGHEITHGFDDGGRVYDKFGNLDSWWSDIDAKKFKEHAQCMIDQYNSYVVPGTGNMTINGITTQDENIADNGGLTESYRAYRKWVAVNGKEPKLPGLSYSNNQLFFVTAAQVWCSDIRDSEKIKRIRAYPHSLDMYRVYGPMQNSYEFAQAFQCPSGSKMNPEHKCAVW